MANSLSRDSVCTDKPKPHNSKLIEFQEELEKIMVGSKQNCSVCYNLVIRLSKHIIETHSPSADDDIDPDHLASHEGQSQSLYADPVTQNEEDPLAAIKKEKIVKQYSNSGRSLRQRKAVDYAELNSRSRLPVSLHDSIPGSSSNANPTTILTVIPVVVQNSHPIDFNTVVVIVDNLKCEPELAEIEMSEDPLYTPSASAGRLSHLDRGILFSQDIQIDSTETKCELDSENEREIDLDDNLELTRADSILGFELEGDFEKEEAGTSITNNSKSTNTAKKHTENKRWICDFCDECFITKLDLKSHAYVHIIDQERQCSICKQQFSVSEELTDHMMESHKEILDKPYQCMICGTGVSKLLELGEHFRQFHPTGLPFACNNCEKRFFDESDLNTHLWSHNEQNSYICEYCHKGYKTLPYLQSHIKSHTKERPYKCATCEKCFNIKECLVQHERLHRDGKTETLENQKLPDKHIGCSICHRAFVNITSLGAHVRDKHEDILGQRYVCEICDERFVSSFRLTEHIKETHPGRKRYECKICHIQCSSKTKLATHSRTHTREKPYSCTVCSRDFNTPSILKRHRRVHTGERPYVCNVCNKSYKSASFLKIHKRSHTGEKPYMCDRCSKRFTSKTSLVGHMRQIHNEVRVRTKVSLEIHSKTHTEDKSYICEYCGKGFAQSPHLKAHSKIHTRENSHICKDCGQSFHRKSSLITHCRVHSGQKVYICKECGNSYGGKSDLNKHSRIHTGQEKSHKCSACGLSFWFANQLNVHLKTQTHKQKSL